MKLKIILFFLFCIITNAQSLYNKQLYGYNGKLKVMTSYLYENQDLEKQFDPKSYKSKTVSNFNGQGELIETNREIKSTDKIYSFRSEYFLSKDQVLQLRYDNEGKLTDSISYTKVNKNLWLIKGKRDWFTN